MHIEITQIELEFTEEAQKRYDDWMSTMKDTPEFDNDGKNREYYENLLIPVPPELMEKSMDEEELYFDVLKDYVRIETDTMVNMELVEDSQRINPTNTEIKPFTIITYTSQRTIRVKQDIETIKQLMKT